MKQRRLMIKDKKIKQLVQNGGRKDAKKDFFELVRRASQVNY